jgi:GNAT superfamily N-acetyltransferase
MLFTAALMLSGILSNMSIKLRKYNRQYDAGRIGEFLVRHYQPGNRDGNFFLPAWEYALTHPLFDEKLLDTFAVWEDQGEITGAVHPECYPGEAFFELHPDFPGLKAEMLDYALKNLGGKDPAGRMSLLAFVPDFDAEFEDLVKARGFQILPELERRMTLWPIPKNFPPIRVPDGFRLQSLADENDIAKLDRCLYRGFNHGPEPQQIDYAGRKKMQSAPGYRKDLNIVAVAPDGRYAAYAGLWFEKYNKFAYVEPVCTDPDYRLRGLGKAAVMEGIRRCGELGATVAYVGNTLPIYLSIGFKHVYTLNCWKKYLDS